MSHIHIPDGVLPLWLWAAGWVLALIALAVVGRASSRSETRRRVPLLAVVSSLMLVAMSSEIVPIAYHVNLTVVSGILLGPWLSPIAAFIVVLMLALLGHGGVTVVGLNALLIASEMILGYLLFHGLSRLVGRGHAPAASGLATFATLAVTTTMLVGIVALAGTSAATERESGALDPSSLRFENPFAEGVFTVGLFSGGEEHADEVAGSDSPTNHDDSSDVEAASTGLSVRRFAAIVYTLGPIGWALEAFVTALIVGYIARMRPSLLWEGAMGVTAPRLVGDEAGGH